MSESKGATPFVSCFGKKKTATAVAHAREGKGLIRLNGKPLSLVTPDTLRLKAFEPVLVVGQDKFAYVPTRLTQQRRPPHQGLGRWPRLADLRDPPGDRQGARGLLRQVLRRRLCPRAAPALHLVRPHPPDRRPASLRAQEVRRSWCARAPPEVVPLIGLALRSVDRGPCHAFLLYGALCSIDRSARLAVRKTSYEEYMPFTPMSADRRSSPVYGSVSSRLHSSRCGAHPQTTWPRRAAGPAAPATAARGAATR